MVHICKHLSLHFQNLWKLDVNMRPSSQHCYGEVGDGGSLEVHQPTSLCRLKLNNRRPDLREDVRQDQCPRLSSDFHMHAMTLVCPKLPTFTSHNGGRGGEEETGWRGREIEMSEKAAL